jgi:urease subunit alpha
MSFVSQAALDAGIVEKYGLERQVVAVKHTRKIGKADMKRNDATPKRNRPRSFPWLSGISFSDS